MTDLRVRVAAGSVTLRATLEWWEVMDVLGRKFYPEGPFLRELVVPEVERKTKAA